MNSETEASLAEQLSALMDGELAEEQARFLRRRLEHDAELRAAWSRLQLASACLRGHRVMPMALDCAAVRADAVQGSRRGWMRWAAVASVAALAVAMAPRFLASPDAVAPDLAATGAITRPVSSIAPVVPSPSTADLVALRPAASPVPAARTSPPLASTSGAALVAAVSAPAPSSPLPLDAQSPADFPLVDTGEKAWPRSGLPGAGNDPQLEAYLVRHNQMLANDGLGGFVPYVDVVAQDPARSAADAVPASAAGPAPESATK